MSQPIRLAVIGAGRRVSRFYADIVPELRRRGLIDIVGLQNRTRIKADELAPRLECPVFDTVEALLADARPDAVILAVAPQVKQSLATRLLESGIHVFMETPAANFPHGASVLEATARAKGRVLEIAEDQAFSPEAQLHAQIARSGALGRVLAVFNDDKEYYYHACARLHALMGELGPVKRFCSENERLSDGARVEFRDVKFASGLHYFHRYSRPKDHPVRATQSWRVVGEKGVITETEAVLLGDAGSRAKFRFEAEGSDVDAGAQGRVTKLSATFAGRTFSWESPFPKMLWTRQHHGIAYLLEAFAAAVRTGSAPAYGIARARQDIEIWKSMELAARVPVQTVPAWAVRSVLALLR